MTLTGKAKCRFLKWLKVRVNSALHEIDKIEFWFSLQDKSFKNALVIEWFDSIGVWSVVLNDTLILDRDYFNKCSWQSNIELLIITANEIYNDKNK